MKIRIHTPSGYISLTGLEFPMVVEAYQIQNKAAHVKASVMQAHGCRETCDLDYVFLEDEFTIVEDSAASLLRAITPSEEDAVDNTGLIAACEAISADRQERKGLLIQLVQDYGVAINNGCYESQCGSFEAMVECHEEEKRLLKEITKMVEEGV